MKKTNLNTDNLSIAELFEIKGGAINNPYACDSKACTTNACESVACASVACQSMACQSNTCTTSAEKPEEQKMLNSVLRAENNMSNSILIR